MLSDCFNSQIKPRVRSIGSDEPRPRPTAALVDPDDDFTDPDSKTSDVTNSIFTDMHTFS